MKTFKTRSGAMKSVNKSMTPMDYITSYSVVNILSSPPPSYTLYLEKINNCDTYYPPDYLHLSGLCYSAGSIGYFEFRDSDPCISISPTSLRKDLEYFNDYKKITKINILDEITYSITYNPKTDSIDSYWIIYTINDETIDTVRNNIVRISEKNSQVKEINGLYQIFTDGGKGSVL